MTWAPSRPRVWHLSSLQPEGHYFRALAQGLPAAGYELSIGSLGRHDSEPDWLEGSPATYFELGSRSDIPTARAVIRLARRLRSNRVDLLHTHLLTASVVGVAAARLARRPIVVVSRHHSDEVARIGSWRSRIADRGATKAADKVVVVTRAVKDYLVSVENVPADRISQIYIGFDFDLLSSQATGGPALRKELGLQDRFVIGCVGRLFPTKGHVHLIDAMARVRGQVPGACLVFVGSGRDPAVEERVRALGLSSRVSFLGHRSDVAACMSAMDVVVQPSLTEPFGQVVVEAMGVGRPVIATDVGGIPEIIENGQTGLLIPPADPGRLAEAILRLQASPAERERLAAAGKRSVTARFTLDRMISEHAARYAEWAGEASG